MAFGFENQEQDRKADKASSIRVQGIAAMAGDWI